MNSSTNKKTILSTEYKTKMISYEEYLQLKKAYMSLKEKNKKLKEEKIRLESILKEYQLHITDYKSSNNKIKVLFQKIENNYKDLKVTNGENNMMLRSKRNNLQNEVNNVQEETFKRTLKDMRDNNEIITNEYNNAINRYIEVINQLNKEIKIKDELLKNKGIGSNIIIEKNNSSHNFFNNLIISSNLCEFNIIQKNKKNKDINLNNNFENKLDISSNICEINIISENKKKESLNELISICSNICEINILSEVNEKTPLNNIFLDNLEIISNISDLNFLVEKTLKNQNLDIISNICEINILANKEKSKDFSSFQNLIISTNISEINIICDNKLTEQPINQELSIISKISEINIIFDENQKKSSNFKILDISSKLNEINILSTQKVERKQTNQIILDISSKICEINIIQKKEVIFKTQKEYFQFVDVKKRKKEKKIKTNNAIFKSYINTLNLGFDNGKKYNNYNIINKEKDEDSDNENDKFECEPIPSFILCIQKKENKKAINK